MKKMCRTLCLLTLMLALVLSLSAQSFAARPPADMLARALDPRDINITSDDTIPSVISAADGVAVTSWYNRDTLDAETQAAFAAAGDSLTTFVSEGAVMRYFFHITAAGSGELTIDLPDEKVNAYSPIAVYVLTPDGPVKMNHKVFNDDAITITFTLSGPAFITVGELADPSMKEREQGRHQEDALSVHREDIYEIFRTNGCGIVLTEYPNRFSLADHKRLYYEKSYHFLPNSVPLDMSCVYFIHIDKGSSIKDPPYDITVDLSEDGIDLSSVVDVKLFKDGAWSHQPFVNNDDGTILCTFSDWGPVALYFEDGSALS